MVNSILVPVTYFAALGSGLMAGVFFAFSVFVMNGLGRLPPAQGVAAMQSISVTVLTPLFLGVFVATAAACGLLTIVGGMRWRESGSPWLILGSVLYLGGIIAVTAAANVPRNNALLALPAESAAAASYWADYLSSWTAWNHVRTVTGLGALLSFIVALRS
jgi:uncharacterized membrane protein